MTEQNTRLGILLMITTTIVFAVQDGISRHLAADYPVPVSYTHLTLPTICSV